MARLKVISLLLAMLPAWVYCQVEATVSLVDEVVQVGKPFACELSVRHPAETVVIFPDSASEFAPFELIESIPRATRTSDGTSIDATVFRLYTWELDSLQTLQFPVQFLDAKGDTQQIISTAATVRFQPVIAVYSDSLKLKMHGDILEIGEPFPWLGILVVVAASLLIATILVLVFNKPARKYLRRLAVKRDWVRFKKSHEEALALLGTPEAFTERIQSNWKRYLDKKGRLKLHAMTTPELMDVLAGVESLSEQDVARLMEMGSLRDRLIFGGINADADELKRIHAEIELIMEKEFQRRKEKAEV